MKKYNIIETIIGAVVLIVAGFFMVFVYNTANLKKVTGYVLHADFTRIDGLQVGNDVKISGVKVGTIIGQKLNLENYLATITFSVNQDIKLPKDTVAQINSESLFGGKYLSLEPGGEEDLIVAGDKIEYTQSTPGLEQLLGQVIFSLSNDKDDKDDKDHDD